MLRRIDVDVQLSSDPHEIEQADRVILPGVGAFDPAMRTLRARGLEGPLRHVALERKRPLLGICLGMQLLLETSAEGTERGLGFIQGHCARFTPDASRGLRVPHMGWNDVAPAHAHPLFAERREELLFSDLEPNTYSYYFVHSFFAVCANDEDVLGRTTHGDEFTSMIARGNVAGAQYHPEKSHKYGMRLFKNFAELG